MLISRQQVVVVILAIVTFNVLYFGCDTKTLRQKSIEKSRALELETTSAEVMIKDAKQELNPSQRDGVLFLEQQAVETTQPDSVKSSLFRELSREWYDLGYPAIAGHYAEKVAEITNTEEAWSIAGTTYAIGIRKNEIAKYRDFSTQRAIKAFENAISLNPEDLAHQINLALCYTENPPPENPMKGIQLLLDLDRKYPDNPRVLNQLASLAIKTGQYEKAVERLLKVLEVDPQNSDAHCLLANVYEKMGDVEKALSYSKKCSEQI